MGGAVRCSGPWHSASGLVRVDISSRCADGPAPDSFWLPRATDLRRKRPICLFICVNCTHCVVGVMRHGPLDILRNPS